MSNYVDYDNAVELFTEVGNKRKASESIQESLLKSTVGWTGKNLLKRTSNPNPTVANVSFTVNADNSITCNGTSSNSLVWIIESVLCKANKEYILTGCPSGGGGSESTNYWLGAYINGTLDKRDIGNGVLLKYTTDTTVEVRLRIPNGYTANNLTFYPMIRKAEITDDTYEPYHESVETMYEEEIHGVNLLKNVSPSKTINGVTFTVNADGSVTANGTATAQCWFSVKDYLLNPLHLDEGSYFVNGCSGGSSSTHFIRVTNGASELVTSYGGETAFNLSSSSDSIGVYIVIGSNQTVSNLVFKPMIRKAEIEDSTYRPYNEQAIQNQLNTQGVLGAKNLAPNIATTNTTNNLTFTINDNKTISTSGTPSANTFLTVSSTRYGLKLEVGKKYKISGCPSGGSVNSYKMDFRYDKNGVTTVVAEDVGNGAEFTYTQDMKNASQPCLFIIRVASGTVMTGKTFKPMLRLASDPDDTYVPYAMTNKELTDDRYYHAGDTVNVSLMNFAALVTNSSKEIRFTIPLMKDLSKITGITFKSTTTVGIRKPGGGYVIDGIISSGYNITILAKSGNLLSIKLTKTDDSAFDATNNTPLDVAFTGGSNDSVITFS